MKLKTYIYNNKTSYIVVDHQNGVYIIIDTKIIFNKMMFASQSIASDDN